MELDDYSTSALPVQLWCEFDEDVEICADVEEEACCN